MQKSWHQWQGEGVWHTAEDADGSGGGVVGEGGERRVASGQTQGAPWLQGPLWPQVS